MCRILVLLLFRATIADDYKCQGVMETMGKQQSFYNPSVMGYDKKRMLNEPYIQYHSLDDFYLFNQMANIEVTNETVAYRIYLDQESKEMNAKCIDGSTPVLYYRPGYGDGINKFSVNIQGGGWCSNVGNLTWQYVPSMDNCYYRSTTFLGTTNFDAPYMTLKNYASTNFTVNPLTTNWNQIFIRYCDGSSYLSNLKQPIVYNNKSLYFRGFSILNAAFTHLVDVYGFKNATDILIVGGSAGALGVWQFANYIREQYVSPTASYMTMPDSGFFLQYEGAGEYIKGWKWKYNNQNLNDALNTAQKQCVDDYTKNNGDLFDCVFAQNIASYVTVKTFALQSRVDHWQLTHELCNTVNDTVVNGYGYNFTQTFLDTFMNENNKNHGAYLDSCMHHCGQWNTIEIDGYNQSIASRDFYYGNLTHSNLFFQNFSYPCTACCNQ